MRLNLLLVLLWLQAHWSADTNMRGLFEQRYIKWQQQKIIAIELFGSFTTAAFGGYQECFVQKSCIHYGTAAYPRNTSLPFSIRKWIHVDKFIRYGHLMLLQCALRMWSGISQKMQNWGKKYIKSDILAIQDVKSQIPCGSGAKREGRPIAYLNWWSNEAPKANFRCLLFSICALLCVLQCNLNAVRLF